VADDAVLIGALPARVAHEINNPLAAMMGNIEVALTALCGCEARAPALERALAALRDAAEAGERVRQIVRDFSALSRTESEARGPVDVERVVESTLRVAWNEIRDRARLVKSYGETARVLANESRLGQVILNLVLNAAQAIDPGRPEENEISVTTGVEPNGRVFIEVADSGHGMSPEVQQRIFAPFFTTKPPGSGMGLGLSICRRLVGSFGGEITVHSRPGQGSRFRVVFPAASATAAQHSNAPRRGRVLLIDDERILGRAMQRALSPEHDVIALTNAHEALALLASGERFDLVLCDMSMPSMDGPAFFEELSRRMPDQTGRVVFLTGSAFSPEARAFLERVGNEYLEKPFELSHLRSLISDRLSD
jgi:CheY-like chemotaxis protein/two-component sensor histidine kinase